MAYLRWLLLYSKKKMKIFDSKMNGRTSIICGRKSLQMILYLHVHCQNHFYISETMTVIGIVSFPVAILKRTCIITVMRIIKLNKFPVPVRLHSGSGKLILSLFYHVLRYLRTLYIVWSLVRRRVTRRITRLQTMHNVLKNCKTF